MRNFFLGLAAVGFLFQGGTTVAQAGSYSITAKQSIKVKPNCGKARETFGMTASITEDGEWSVEAPAGDFGGTYVTTDRHGRKLTLSFDDQSFDDYINAMADWAAELCETPITGVTGYRAKKMQAKLNKKKTAIKVLMVDSATGTTAFGSGSMKHSLKGKGRSPSGTTSGSVGVTISETPGSTGPTGDGLNTQNPDSPAE